MKRNRIIYALLTVGAIGAFLGHGMFAVDSKDSFIKLFTGSFDHVLGVTVSTETATTWVNAIGWLDIGVAVVLTAMLVGSLRGRGRLYELAYSPIALVIYGWATLWGFVTAASRMTAVGQFLPEVWDLVERAPNFMLPAALMYLIYQHRLDHSRTKATTESIEKVPQSS